MPKVQLSLCRWLQERRSQCLLVHTWQVPHIVPATAPARCASTATRALMRAAELAEPPNHCSHSTLAVTPASSNQPLLSSCSISRIAPQANSPCNTPDNPAYRFMSDPSSDNPTQQDSPRISFSRMAGVRWRRKMKVIIANARLFIIMCGQLV